MNKIQFKDMEISAEIKRAVEDMGFEEATAIQTMSIPLILAGHDVLGHSQTGSGKTAAFGIPAIEMLDATDNKRALQVLILCPTRELAVQACDEIKKFSKYKQGIKAVPIYGGQPIDRQIALLRQGAQIVIGTPGRVMDHMRRKTLKLESLKMIILDEADEMLNMGFREDIETILKDTPEVRQTVLFSATMPPPILEITRKFQKNPEIVKVQHQQLTVPTIEQFYYETPKGQKTDVLCRLLDVYDPKLSMVFCNTKKMVDELVNELQTRGYQSEGLHGDMKQTSRTQVMNRFKSGNFDILVATDVAARGIDVNDIEAVFNYDIPQDEEYYVHRIGRTGRAGKTGRAFTLISGRSQVYALRDIQRFTKAKIELKPLPTLSEVMENKIQKYVTEVREVLSEGNFSQYVETVEALMGEEYTSVDIAAAIIAMNLKNDKKTDNAPNVISAPNMEYERDFGGRGGRRAPRGSERTFERKDRGGHKDLSKMSRIMINIGKVDHVAPNHILGAVAGESGVAGKLIGGIDIQSKYTYVDVPKDQKQHIIDSLDNCKINGRKVKVEAAKTERKASFKPY